MQISISLILSALLSLILVGCGNKGDLYLVPDQISQEDLQQLEQVVRSEDIPTAEPVDVDDQSVFEDEEKKKK